MEFKSGSVLYPPFCRESHVLNVNKSWWEDRRAGKDFLEDLEMSFTEELEPITWFSRWLGEVGRVFRPEDTEEWDAKGNAHGREEGNGALEVGEGPISGFLSCGKACLSLAWMLARSLVPEWEFPQTEDWEIWRLNAGFALRMGEGENGLSLLWLGPGTESEARLGDQAECQQPGGCRME